MPLGTEVGLGPGDIVLDGDPAPTKRGTAPPAFRPVSIVAKRSPISETAELVYSVAVVNASRSLQCFDAVGWVTRRASGLWLVSNITPVIAAIHSNGRPLYFAGVVSIFVLLLSSFLLNYSQQSEIGCLPYFHT